MKNKMTSKESAQYVKSEALKLLNAQVLSEGVKDIIAQEGLPAYESQEKLQPYDVAFRGLFLKNIRRVKCDYKAAWDNMVEHFEQTAPEKLEDKEFMKGLMKVFSEYVGEELYSKLDDRFEKSLMKAQEPAGEVAEGEDSGVQQEPVKLKDFVDTYQIQPSGEGGKYMYVDFDAMIPQLTDRGLYNFALMHANRYIGNKLGGMTWDDLGDTNSLWDYIEKGMSTKEIVAGAIDASKERLQNEAGDMGMEF